MQFKSRKNATPLLAVVAFASLFVQICKAGSIADSLLSKVSSQGSHDAVLELPSVMGQVLSHPLLSTFTGTEAGKTNMMVNLMKHITSTSQLPFMSTLSMLGVEEVEPFWITNKISMKNVPLPVLQTLSALPGTFKIREPIPVNIAPSVVHNNEGMYRSVSLNAGEIQWGVQKIGAPNVWNKTRGAGIIVANIDTGVNYLHESLKSNYAGKWYDAISRKTTPYDDHGHGTHTMGTICGTTRGIGVAPGAKWIACKGLGRDGSATDTTLSACAQWVLQQKPNVVSNSWGGGSGQTFFNDEIAAWINANIIPVFSIGNSGPNCATAGSPGDQPNVFSVGSTRSDDSMSGFSSRGLNKLGKLKPEVSAPGDPILSAGFRNATSYVSMSGTSMACPHVAGAVALMRSANPSLTYDQVRNYLQGNATRPAVSTNDLNCGRPPNGTYPNNAYGYGRINVQKAMAL